MYVEMTWTSEVMAKENDMRMSANSEQRCDATELKNLGCDLVICLSHLGFEYKSTNKVSDMTLAENSNNIDIILGGHTHTFLDEPVVKRNMSNKNVLINQVGWAGIQLGRIDIDLKKAFIGKQNVVIR